MVHTVIYAHPYPAASPVSKDAPMCPGMLPRDGKVPFACTRERGHAGYHQATNLGSAKKLAEWSDE